MTIRLSEHENGFLVYKNTQTRKVARVWKEDLEAIGEICEMFDQNGAMTAMVRVADGDYSYRALSSALSELREVRDAIIAQHIRLDEDDYIDLLTAIDDLEGILRRVRAIS